MFRKTLFALTLLAFSATVSAEAPKENGIYVGVSGGTAIFDDDGGIGFFDDQDTAIQGYIGYKFFKHFGIEARAADFGGYSDGFDTLDISSVSVHAVGYIPFGTSGWELFGQIGYAQMSEEVAGFYDENDTAGTAGIGVRWHINPSFAVGIQVDAYVWENDLVGSNYDLSIGTQLLSVQFSF